MESVELIERHETNGMTLIVGINGATDMIYIEDNGSKRHDNMECIIREMEQYEKKKSLN